MSVFWNGWGGRVNERVGSLDLEIISRLWSRRMVVTRTLYSVSFTCLNE